ncbi:hypothetical protein [Burkholderia singularis]|uniref:Uncharacterized protein n=1 Tax=Burkholderia singularis TaxID=1503053 RepID=A0A238H6V2_9BURK|nr:hypothetical protein [Burkholderia singularis]SMG01049.1 hypothetical protein BSIN_4035 [Burkholderia singularis]
MTKNTIASVTLIGVTALEGAAFVAWKGFGIDAAGNVLMFWLSFISVIGILLLAALPRDFGPQSDVPKSAFRRSVESISTIAMIAALAWYGHFVMAGFYVLGQAEFVWYRSRLDACREREVA